MNQKLELGISSTIFILLLIAIYFLQPTIPVQPHGIILPVAPTTAIQPAQVQILLNDPTMQPVAGYINVEYLTKDITASTSFAVVNYVKVLAASIGANKINVIFTGYSPEMQSLQINGLALTGDHA